MYKRHNPSSIPTSHADQPFAHPTPHPDHIPSFTVLNKTHTNENNRKTRTQSRHLHPLLASYNTRTVLQSSARDRSSTHHIGTEVQRVFGDIYIHNHSPCPHRHHDDYR